MSLVINESKEICDGQTAVPLIGDPMVYIDNGTEVTLKSFGKLETDVARKAFFDKMLATMDRNFSSNWQQVYEVIRLVQENEWYWKSKGYSSFPEFWKNQGRFSFEQFKTLEHAHLYATLVEPELFGLSKEKAIATFKFLQKVRPKMTTGAPIGNNNASKKKSSTVVFDGPTPAELREAGEAYRKFGSSGSAGLAYRFARLLRDAPKIAADVQKGKYIKKQKNGKLRVDLEQAEKDAGIWKEKKKRPSAKRSAGERAIDTLNKATKAELEILVERMGSRLRKQLLSMLQG